MSYGNQLEVRLLLKLKKIGENLKNEEDFLTEDKLAFNQNDYNPTKLTKIQHTIVFVHDIETYPDQQNGDCVPNSVKYFPALKSSNSTVYKFLTDVEIDNL